MSDLPQVPDRWAALKRTTPARIGLARAGQSLALSEVLAFQLAHARARDAVHAVLDVEALRVALAMDTQMVTSMATNRDIYLRRPDLGRRLSETAAARLADLSTTPVDLAVVLVDGLSAKAVHASGPALALRIVDDAAKAGLSCAPFVVATQGRVALGDAIAETLKAGVVVVLIGERPGLSAVDSLGAYITYEPRAGISTDADRNCISNIRDGGLPVDEAAARIHWLLIEARRRGASGVALKDESGLIALPKI